jgi:AcrR family transcriptional regulator
MALRRDAQRNRDALVVSARDLIASGGVDVPVEEITRRAGVGMGTLYRHFPTKSDLVDAVLEETLDSYVGLARDALEVEDAWEGFAGFLEQALALHAANRGLKAAIASSAHGRERARAARRRIRPLLRQLVERAQAQGTLRSDLTAEDVPMLLWAGGGLVEAAGDVAPDLWRRYLALLLDGLRAGATTPLPAAPLTKAELARIA